MASSSSQTVDEYLKRLPAAERQALERIRAFVKQLVPQAEESISYQIPAFKYRDKPLLYYAAFKKHMSVFPTTGPTELLQRELADYETSKGTIKFTLDKPLSDKLLQIILETKIREIDG